MAIFGNTTFHNNPLPISPASYYVNYLFAALLLLHLAVSTLLNPIVFYYHYKYVKYLSFTLF